MIEESRLTDIPSGSNVKLHVGNSWSIQEQVVHMAQTPQSYVVQTAGRQLRRNCQDLLVVPGIQPTAEEPRQPPEHQNDAATTVPKEPVNPFPQGSPLTSL